MFNQFLNDGDAMRNEAGCLMAHTGVGGQLREVPGRGILIVNADDWGRNRHTTDRTFDCVRRGAVSSVSAMVFMEDSERAATVAREYAVDTGLHLNLTTPFQAANCPTKLRERQGEIARHLLRHRFAQVVFHPGLIEAFRYVVRAQFDEFSRLYGHGPSRLDGHHHMHLSANVLIQGLLPPNTIVRRSFSFESGEKSIWNRYYRRAIDSVLSRHHRMSDYFFSLSPLDPLSRLNRIFSLAHEWAVEVEAHPVKDDEYRFLTEDGIARIVNSLAARSLSAISLRGRSL
ncbi:MAG: ChbG/HpnK family deacetylase [Nitrospira sp.]